MTKQKNDPQMRKRPGAKLPQACGFILPPWPGYPSLGCSSAEPNSVSPGNRKHTMPENRAGRIPAKRAHRETCRSTRSDTSQTRPPAPGDSETRKIRSDRPLPTSKFEEITGRNPTNHWLVSTRPSVAGFNAPRDRFLVLVGSYVCKVAGLLARWRCPHCRKTFTDPFAM